MKNWTLTNVYRYGSIEGGIQARNGKVLTAAEVMDLGRAHLDDVAEDHNLTAPRSSMLAAYKRGFKHGFNRENKRYATKDNPGGKVSNKIQIVVPPGTPVKVLGNPGARITRRKINNVEQGFYAGGVFHPIRASSDYDPSRVGEDSGARRKRKKATKKTAKRKATAKKATRKRTTKKAAPKVARKKTAKKAVTRTRKVTRKVARGRRRNPGTKSAYGVRVNGVLAYVGSATDATKAATKLRQAGKKRITRGKVNPNPITGKMPSRGWRSQFR